MKSSYQIPLHQVNKGYYDDSSPDNDIHITKAVCFINALDVLGYKVDIVWLVNGTIQIASKDKIPISVGKEGKNEDGMYTYIIDL